VCDPGRACTSASRLDGKTFRVLCRQDCQDCQDGAAGDGVKIIGFKRLIVFLQVSDLLKSLSTLVLNMLTLPSAMQLSDLSPYVRDLEQDLSPAEACSSAGFIHDLSVPKGLSWHPTSLGFSCMLAITSSHLKEAYFHRMSVDRSSSVFVQAAISEGKHAARNAPLSLSQRCSTLPA
jgi:hypothetical protein